MKPLDEIEKPAGSVRIVRASASDEKAVLRLLQAQYELHGTPFSERRIAKLIACLLRDDDTGSIWLLQDGSQSVGIMVLTWAYDVEFGGPIAVLTDLYVAKEHRRKGLGSAALRFAQEYCRKLGACALELQ